jgi:DNA polymerase sigma
MVRLVRVTLWEAALHSRARQTEQTKASEKMDAILVSPFVWEKWDSFEWLSNRLSYGRKEIEFVSVGQTEKSIPNENSERMQTRFFKQIVFCFRGRSEEQTRWPTASESKRKKEKEGERERERGEGEVQQSVNKVPEVKGKSREMANERVKRTFTVSFRW